MQQHDPSSPASLDRRTDYAKTDRRDRHILPIINRFVLDALRQHRAPRADSVAIDVGCGEGPFRQAIKEAGYRYVGFDVQQNSTNTVDMLGPIDQPLPADAAALPPADLLMCTEVMEHVADWAAALTNMRKLAAPGGIVILTCPFFWPLHEEPYDFWRPTPHAIRTMAERHGFEIAHFEKGGSAAEVLSTAVGVAALKNPSGPLGKARRNLAALGRAALQRLLVSDALKLITQLDGDLYLANLAILRATGDVSSR